uniref:G-protein coupled receptors family 2 profile 2 domain-containing protein n=1 Tax=Amphimedon queenslandica TaxID=400682 RepID=A0A1X7VR61_AMPQE
MSLAAPTVTSIGLIYCPPDGIWYSTLSNSTINGTCYKGTVTASRLCKSNGEWDEIVCHTNRQFNNILNISNMSFTTAIQALLNITATDDDGGITTEQKVILFDTIINNNENQSLEGLEERTELLLALENNIKQELINEDEDTRQSGYGQILLSMDKYALSINRNYTKTSDNISVPALYMIIMIPIGLLVGTEDHVNYLLYANNELIACWLDYESGFIWSFIIPVIIILLINIGFFAMAIIIMKKHRKNRISNENSLKDDAKYWIKSSISLTIVMGIGWIGNVFFFSEELLFIAYIMTVFISAQGIIIFILYVPLSNNVRKVMWRWCKNNLPRSLMNKLIKDKKATEVLTIIIII